jgi:hypothetical protein
VNNERNLEKAIICTTVRRPGMRTIVIKDCKGVALPNAYTLDLRGQQVKDCTGCWSCWWKTPGRCIFGDLDEFYHQYVTADKAVFFLEVTRGFVSGNIKTLFDRMLPLYLPYVTYTTGESMHVPRYESYPDIEVYFDGAFDTPAGEQIFVDYIDRVFYQFHCENRTVQPLTESVAEGGSRE